MSIVKSLIALAVIAAVIWATVARNSSVAEQPSGRATAVAQEIQEPTERISPNQRKSADTDEAVRSAASNADEDAPAIRISVDRAVPQSAVEQSSVPTVDAERLDSAQHVRSVVVPRTDPFPVSASVVEDCLKYGDLRNHSMPEEPTWEYEDKCLTVRRGLATFIEEDRLEPWASETEALFRRSFKIDPHECAVRNLECRSTLCVYECTYLGRFNIAAQDSYMNKYGLGHYSDVEGIERDESGNLIVVRLAVFARE